MRRTTRLKTLADRAGPPGRAPQDNTHPRASALAAPADPTLGGHGLDSGRMTYAPGRPRSVNRTERRRAEQTDDKREGEKAFAGEIHVLSGVLT
jgi:hypothetical protein